MSNRMPLEGVAGGVFKGVSPLSVEILMSPAGPGPFYPPAQGYESDAGWDLVVSSFIIVGARSRVRLQHNLRLAIPHPYYGLIVPRSSTLQNTGLIVLPGLIDSGYRGDVMTVVYNTSHVDDTKVEEGARVSQLLILKKHDLTWRKVRDDQLPLSDRGVSGFGSTNKSRK